MRMPTYPVSMFAEVVWAIFSSLSAVKIAKQIAQA
jgi:hypothetical protein